MKAIKYQIEDELKIDVVTKTLPMIRDFDKIGLNGNFINDVIVDLPTAVFTMRRSPRKKIFWKRLVDTLESQRQEINEREPFGSV